MYNRTYNNYLYNNMSVVHDSKPSSVPIIAINYYSYTCAITHVLSTKIFLITIIMSITSGASLLWTPLGLLKVF